MPIKTNGQPALPRAIHAHRAEYEEFGREGPFGRALGIRFEIVDEDLDRVQTAMRQELALEVRLESIVGSPPQRHEAFERGPGLYRVVAIDERVSGGLPPCSEFHVLATPWRVGG